MWWTLCNVSVSLFLSHASDSPVLYADLFPSDMCIRLPYEMHTSYIPLSRFRNCFQSTPTLVNRESALGSFGLREHMMRFTSMYSFTSARSVTYLLDEFVELCSK